MHTVYDWVKNYKKHPGGWAALLMIHGIPEVTGRLRSKVPFATLRFVSYLTPSMEYRAHRLHYQTRHSLESYIFCLTCV